VDIIGDVRNARRENKIAARRYCHTGRAALRWSLLLPHYRQNEPRMPSMYVRPGL
jgi:hypothetical protein